jgi:hypothetical protein
VNISLKILCYFFLFGLIVSCKEKSTKVKPVDLSAISPDAFTPEEWFVPYYLKNFHRVANSVLDTGANKGFINIPVWRQEEVNHPYNARIMESILSLVWFYTKQKPWNPYYGDAALRNKIELALTFWCNMQNEDGRFSEYAYDRWSLAPTAFATKFIGRALTLLEQGPPIDQNILSRTQEAMRKALYVGFTNEDLWEHGRNFTNQFANLWGGAAMYLKNHPDKELEQLFVNRLDQSMVEFQSPCGYFYEKNGPDWGYNLSTHHSDLHVAWHFMKGSRLKDYIIDKTEQWYDWFAMNAVKEPGLEYFYVNKPVETRQQKWFIQTDTVEDPAHMRWTPQAQFIPIARAFSLSETQYQTEIHSKYDRMKLQFPYFDDLRVGDFSGFSPYAFLHDELIHWLPTDEQKKEAVEALPYLKRSRFTEIRKDNRNNTSYTFVRRPKYYFIFNAGKILTPQQRYGIGLIWTPALGTFFQSQSNSSIAAWGTKASTDTVYETKSIAVEFFSDQSQISLSNGKNEIQGNLKMNYDVGSAQKEIQLLDDKIVVTINHPGEFTEVLPFLLTKDSEITLNDQQILYKNDQQTVVINARGNNSIIRLVENFNPKFGIKNCEVIEISSTSKLSYEINFY